MKEKAYSLNFDGCNVRYSFLVPKTRRVFGNYLTECNDTEYDIRLSRDFIEECRWLATEDTSDDYLEYYALMIATAKFLLPANRTLIHGASFLWKNRAWLITAPSGTGKTTQLRNWQEIVKNDMTVINGDKPVISCREDGNTYLSSSPWRGKEWYGNRDISAELGGIILLEQGDHNEIKRLCSKDAVFPLFMELLSYPDNTDQIHMMGRLLDKILDHTPVWKLTNLGDLDSTELTRKTIWKYMEAPQ